MSESENDRQYRVLDQMLSAHAMLRDQYRRKALLLNTGLLTAAIALNAFVFAGDDVLVAMFGLKPEHVRMGLGIASVATMILSILELRVDWPGKARSHAEAADHLCTLRARFRESYDNRSAGRPVDTDSVDVLTQEYNRTMAALPAIPDKRFLGLKAAHQHKRLLSQEISAHPSAPVVLLSLKLKWKAIRATCGKGHSHGSDAVDPQRKR